MSEYTFFYEGPFSNWSRAGFYINVGEERLYFNTSEQYMMYMKAITFNDTETAKAILAASHPSAQKMLGRLVKNFDPEVWDRVSFDIVYEGCKQKFLQNSKHLKALLDTGDTTLVEASPEDKIWGIGMAMGSKGLNDPSNWKGENRLGNVLTKLRNDFRKELNK